MSASRGRRPSGAIGDAPTLSFVPITSGPRLVSRRVRLTLRRVDDRHLDSIHQADRRLKNGIMSAETETERKRCRTFEKDVRFSGKTAGASQIVRRVRLPFGEIRVTVRRRTSVPSRA